MCKEISCHDILNRAACPPHPPARQVAHAAGRQSGQSNYNTDEVMVLLKATEAVLPISGTDWELVANHHASYYPKKERMGKYLKKKFNKLAKSLIPTGNPDCPDYVRSAK